MPAELCGSMQAGHCFRVAQHRPSPAAKLKTRRQCSGRSACCCTNGLSTAAAGVQSRPRTAVLQLVHTRTGLRAWVTGYTSQKACVWTEPYLMLNRPRLVPPSTALFHQARLLLQAHAPCCTACMPTVACRSNISQGTVDCSPAASSGHCSELASSAQVRVLSTGTRGAEPGCLSLEQANIRGSHMLRLLRCVPSGCRRRQQF